MLGYIYKIVHISDKTVLPYIGSTKCTLSRRFTEHKQNFKKWKEGKNNTKCMVFEYFEEFGVELFKIVEIERYEVEDRQQLRKHEQEWIDCTLCCNKMNAYGKNINKERERKRLYLREYRKTDNMKEKEKERAETEHYKEYNKTYRQQDKHCELCNHSVKILHFQRHKRSQKHQLNEINFYFSALPRL